MHYEERIHQLWTRLQGYPLWEVLLELLILWGVVYVIVRFLRGTRGARVIKGLALVLIIVTPAIKFISSENEFERLNYLYGQFVTFAALTLVIVFQPELRRALVRLGEARLFRGGLGEAGRMVEEVIGAVAYLSRNKIGALIVFERHVGLEGIVEAGTRVDAVVSKEILNTIFWPGSALHDMAVIIREDRLVAAGVLLPLAEGEHFSSELGSRHRAAIGVTMESDALVVVVSEETGIVSIAQRGRLVRNLTLDSLRTLLLRGLGQEVDAPESKGNAA